MNHKEGCPRAQLDELGIDFHPPLEEGEACECPRWIASIERPTYQSIECDSFEAATRAADGLQRIAYANGYGIQEYGHPVFPVATISEVNVEADDDYVDGTALYGHHAEI